MLLAGCDQPASWHSMDVSGSAPPLQFAMTRASDGKLVTNADYRGQVVLLYFGYTFCPDVCPTTLNAVADAMDKLGPAAARVQPLFITVDPKRDTPKVMKLYAAAFGSDIEGLTGTPEQI
ncbi:MAG: SCO family protein, partial [Rhodoferax sp.]